MTREKFMDIVHSELHSYGDSYMADRIIDAADKYAKEQASCDMKQRVEKEYLYESLFEDLKKANVEINRFSELCDDAISRQIISDYVQSHIQEINTGYGDLNKHTNEILRMIVDYIESMPPVTPQPKVGHWEWVQYDYNPKLGDWHCSECRSVVVECVDKNEKGGIPMYKYCPQCGIKMKEVEE